MILFISGQTGFSLFDHFMTNHHVNTNVIFEMSPNPSYDIVRNLNLGNVVGKSNLNIYKKVWRVVSLSSVRQLSQGTMELQLAPLGYFAHQSKCDFKFFVGQNFRHQAEISTILSDFCMNFVLKHWTKFSTDTTFSWTKFSTLS